MEGFSVQLRLGAPVAVGMLPYGPTLDSVLLGLLSGGQLLAGAEEEDLLQRLSSMLAVEADVPAASALVPEAASLAWGVDVHPRVPSDAEMFHWRVVGTGYETGKAEYLTKLHSVRTVFAESWRWYGVGDVERVAEVLGSLLSVGARRGSGYGMVASWSIDATPDPAWLLNGVGDDVRLGRPVPVGVVDRLLAAEGVEARDLAEEHAVVDLPRWPRPAWGADPDPVPTMVPVMW